MNRLCMESVIFPVAYCILKLCFNYTNNLTAIWSFQSVTSNTLFILFLGFYFCTVLIPAIADHVTLFLEYWRARINRVMKSLFDCWMMTDVNKMNSMKMRNGDGDKDVNFLTELLHNTQLQSLIKVSRNKTLKVYSSNWRTAVLNILS